MENRFGFRDLILCVFLLVIIVGQWIGMKQSDRVWDEIQEMSERQTEQTRDLTYLRKQLAEITELQTDQMSALAFLRKQLAESSERQIDQTRGLDELRKQLAEGSKRQSDQARDLADLRKQLSESIVVDADERLDPFDRVKAAQQMPGYAQGDWMVEAFGAQPPKLTPLISSDTYGSTIQNRVIECLAIRDPDTLEYKPLLAKSWQRSDDGLTITFQIRRGITFSDGEPMDADDFVFTYNWIMNPEVAAPRARAYYDQFKSVTKNGQYELVFQFKRPYFESFGLACGFGVMPEHFYSQYEPQQFNQSTGLLMGTGPYRLESPSGWSPTGDPIVLVRNERYWGEPAPFDRLVFKIVNDASVRRTMFTNGELDSFGAQPEQYRDLIKDESVMADNHHFEYYSPRGSYGYIAWNQRRDNQATIFADKGVRQAMTLMSDRQRLCDEIFLGYGTPANGPFHFLGEQADPDLKARPFDLEAARKLLRQAGFADRDDDGVLEFRAGADTTLTVPDGTPFRFKLTYPSSSKLYQRVVLFFKDTYARAGVDIEPDPVDWPIMIQKLDNRQFDAISLGWSSGFEIDIYQMFHSSQIQDNADNFMQYVSAELDELIDKARGTVDEAQRMPLWRACHRILYEDQPYTFLYRRKSLAFMNNRLHNVQRTRAGLNYVSLWVYPIEWFVPQTMQKWAK